MPFDLPRLRIGLKPYRLYWFPRLRSTNDHAARLRRAGELYAPAALLTGRQIAGRGRGKNTWWSSAGVLTVTFALPLHERIAPQELPLIAGLAVRNAAAEITGNDDIRLKWPNDVLFRDRKLAGLLCERVSNVDLIGIGLNVNVEADDPPEPLADQVTSLLRIGRRRYDITDVLLTLTHHLRHNVRRRMEAPFAAFVKEYSMHDGLAGRKVSISPGGHEPPITGTCQGIDAMGRLLVRDRRKTRAVVAGVVKILPGGPAKRLETRA